MISLEEKKIDDIVEGRCDWVVVSRCKHSGEVGWVLTDGIFLFTQLRPKKGNQN